MKKPGIYQIRNTVTGMRYVGQSGDMLERLNGEARQLRRGKHHNSYLQRSWNKHSLGTFTLEILAIIEPRLLTLFEQRAFDVLSRKHGCYNLGPFTDNWIRGKRHTESTKRRISKSLMGKGFTPERLHNMSEAQKNSILSREHRYRMHEANKQSMLGNSHSLGYRHTIEARQRMSKFQQNRKRKPHSVETRLRMGIAQRARRAGEAAD